MEKTGIEMDCIWVYLKNVGPTFFKFISVYIKMSFKQLENHSQLLCGRENDCPNSNRVFRFSGIFSNSAISLRIRARGKNISVILC